MKLIIDLSIAIQGKDKEDLYNEIAEMIAKIGRDHDVPAIITGLTDTSNMGEPSVMIIKRIQKLSNDKYIKLMEA